MASASAQGGQRDARGNPVQAQTPHTSSQYGKRKGPRAIAVVRWDADAKDTAVPVLVPVVILEEGKFYDASVYKAAPTPMPLDTGNVYEAQEQGELLGYFTIKNQERNSQKQNWVALGEWQSATPTVEKLTSKRTSSVEVVNGPLTEQTGANPGDNNDDRDLKKKTTTVYDENGKPMPEGTQASPAAPMGGAGNDRPTLKRAPSSSQGSDKSGSDSKDSAKDSSGQKKTADDTDRPTLKRQSDSSASPSGTPPQTSPASSSKPAATDNTKDANPTQGASTQDDPDRPPLKRGKPTTKISSGGLPQAVDKDPDRPVIKRNSGKNETAKQQSVPVPPRVLDRGPLLSEGSGGPMLRRTRTYEAVAVSDATIDPPQNFHYKMSSDEKETLQAKVDALAQNEVDKYLKTIGRTRAGIVEPTAVPKKTLPSKSTTRKAATAKDGPPAKSEFAEAQFQVMDLNHRNDPVLIFSGRERAAPQGEGAAQDVYVVYVARVDYEGKPRGVFRSVTVSDRLDVTPKLELIDGVDVNGDGNGELLFRRVADDGAEFAIYKVTLDGMTEIYHGGTAD